MFSKCVLYNFPYLNGLDVYLLQTGSYIYVSQHVTPKSVRNPFYLYLIKYSIHVYEIKVVHLNYTYL